MSSTRHAAPEDVWPVDDSNGPTVMGAAGRRGSIMARWVFVRSRKTFRTSSIRQSAHSGWSNGRRPRRPAVCHLTDRLGFMSRCPICRRFAGVCSAIPRRPGHLPSTACSMTRAAGGLKPATSATKRPSTPSWSPCRRCRLRRFSALTAVTGRAARRSCRCIPAGR